MVTWHELENATSVQIEGHSLCAWFKESFIAFSFDGVILGSYDFDHRLFTWQTKKHVNKRKACRLFLNNLLTGKVVFHNSHTIRHFKTSQLC